ncbi:MAG: tyrosine-type recombinase/integrase [Halanaeroarchaeum sp.]
MASVTDPIAYFLDDMEYHGRSERTVDAYRRVLRSFESFIDSRRRDSADSAIDEATHRDCLEWVHDLREKHADSTIASYASYVNRFYAYMIDVGEFDDNPMALVMEEMDERIETDPSRRDVSLDSMRSFLSAVSHPLERAVIATLLKTGIRAGELCNLDVRDVNLDDVALSTDEPRPALRDHPDSLYVSAAPKAGETINGERRSESNKRKRDTRIPIDSELKRVLERWLAIRPDPRSPADPLFVRTNREWGTRLTGSAVHHIVEQHAREYGWYETNGDAGTNVTPHYFRHFFTTHLRDRTGDRGIVKYLRGDVASDIIDTYTHNWGDRVRREYEANIYELL